MHTFYFNPKDGHFNFEKPSDFKALPKYLRKRRHVMEIKEYTARRSNGANAYYWKVVIAFFMDEMGIPDSKSGRNYMHYDVLGYELRQIPDPNRPGKTMTQQTHTMDASTFWKYIYRCETFFYDQFVNTTDSSNSIFPPPKSNGYDTTKV